MKTTIARSRAARLRMESTEPTPHAPDAISGSEQRVLVAPCGLSVTLQRLSTNQKVPADRSGKRGAGIA